MTYLHLDRIVKRYGSRTVLHDVTLEVEAGEFVSLLGPSGCGKTTLLRIVAGFEHPDGGQVWLEGDDITARPPASRQMGMVFQAYSLFPNMTAEENVRFGLRVRRQDAATQRKRAGELLELVGLSAHAHKFPHQLSGGQQQRVAIARALVNDPKILLCDEPTGNLDLDTAEQVLELLDILVRKAGKTMIMATHSQEVIGKADRVFSISNKSLHIRNEGNKAAFNPPHLSPLPEGKGI